MKEIWYTVEDIRRLNPDMVEQPELTDGESSIALDLAKQLHWSWGTTRINRGFQYGEQRTELTHPNLVQELPESERNNDLEDARTVLSVLKGMGYTLVKTGETNEKPN